MEYLFKNRYNLFDLIMLVVGTGLISAHGYLIGAGFLLTGAIISSILGKKYNV